MHKNIDCFTLDQMDFDPVTQMDATTLRSRMKTVKSLLDAGRLDEAKNVLYQTAYDLRTTKVSDIAKDKLQSYRGICYRQFQAIYMMRLNAIVYNLRTIESIVYNLRTIETELSMVDKMMQKRLVGSDGDVGDLDVLPMDVRMMIAGFVDVD